MGERVRTITQIARGVSNTAGVNHHINLGNDQVRVHALGIVAIKVGTTAEMINRNGGVETIVPCVSGERTLQEQVFINTYNWGKLPIVRLFCLCAVLGFRMVVNKTSAWSNCKISGTGQAWLV